MSASTMARLQRVLLFLWCLQSTVFSDPSSEPCVMELSCPECLPDNMPLVTSHAAAAGAVRADHGDEIVLVCAGGKFLAYPLLESVSAVCEGGLYRVRHDGQLRTVLELGCQQDIFEDVLHDVEHCGAPLQGRAYQTRRAGAGGGARHLATVCFDADRGVAGWARAGRLRLPPHAERRAPLTLLGNFNHMFDAGTRAAAERLYAAPARMTRRLHQLFKPDRFPFAGLELAPGKLLAAEYFEDQDMRVTDFVSNQVPLWAPVAAGNLRHLQRDVAAALRRRALVVYAGTHGTLSLRTAAGRRDVFLKPGRFPAPRYVWTVVLDPATNAALALVALNDPFVSVSEVRDAVFCESACGRVPWLRELRRLRNYEVPAYGLVFCCHVHDFTPHVAAMPKQILKNVPPGDAGMLFDIVANKNQTN